MKILIVGPAHPYRGGIAALNERLAIQLQKEGHSVELINFTLQYPGFLFPGKSQYTNSKPPEGLIIKRLLNSVNPFNWINTGLKLRKKNTDLILVRFWIPFMGPSTGTICKIAKYKRKTKVIAIVDNLIPHESRIGDNLFTKYFTNQCDGLIAMSDCVYNDLDLFRKKQPKAITPHPIYDHYGAIVKREDALKKLNLDPKFNYLLFFGFIRDYKGLDILLEAIAKEKVTELNLKLIVAGEFYSNEEKYTKLISDLSLSSTVHIIKDYIPDDEINLYFSAADIITQPYKTATQSGVTQIGYHFNKPMLVTNVGGLAEIIDHNINGYVVDPNPNAIAEAIYDFFKNDRNEPMTKEVVRIKQRFSWDKLTKTIFEIKKLCS